MPGTWVTDPQWPPDSVMTKANSRKAAFYVVAARRAVTGRVHESE